jgi:Zn-dependent peptidase ImmA (M78 family)
MKDIVVSLLLWISSNSSLVYDGTTTPGVIKVDKHELVNEMYDGSPPFALNVNNVSAIGLYNFNKGDIYLLDRIDLDTVEGRSVLLHELVHFLQYEHGIEKTVSCKRKLELLAYTLEKKYLISHNVSPYFDSRHIQRANTCKTRPQYRLASSKS